MSALLWIGARELDRPCAGDHPPDRKGRLIRPAPDLAALVEARRLSAGLAALLLTWRHSGSSVYGAQVVLPEERERLARLARYAARPPLAQERVRIGDAHSCRLCLPRNCRTGATDLQLDVLEMIHRLTEQIPDPCQHLRGCCGVKANRARRHDRADEAGGGGGTVGPGRHGYRRITAMLRQEGWDVNPKRVERIWRREGLKVPTQQPKRSRLWLNDGSCSRLRTEHKDHVWAYDRVHARTHEGRPLRLPSILDEYTRECLAIVVARRRNSENVLEALAGLFVMRGFPRYLRSDNGSEFTARAVRDRLMRAGVQTRFTEPGSPWENGSIESFNGRLRDELLRGEIFGSLKEACVVIESWRHDDNEAHPAARWDTGHRLPRRGCCPIPAPPRCAGIG